jgi:hypothetical protein
MLEALDAIGRGRTAEEVGRALVVPELDVVSTMTVYVPRDVFVEDLASAFRNDDAMRRQVELDVPRSHVEVDGERRRNAPLHGVSRHLLPMCTQAVLGLPITLLHSTTRTVLDGRGPMIVHVSTHGGAVVVFKDMDVVVASAHTPASPQRVRVMVSAADASQSVCIRYFARDGV